MAVLLVLVSEVVLVSGLIPFGYVAPVRSESHESVSVIVAPSGIVFPTAVVCPNVCVFGCRLKARRVVSALRKLGG